MTLAVVRGTVVATKRADKVDGARWLLVEECNQRGQGRGEYLVGLDMVGAERGQVVLLTQGSSCRWTRGRTTGPWTRWWWPSWIRSIAADRPSTMRNNARRARGFAWARVKISDRSWSRC